MAVSKLETFERDVRLATSSISPNAIQAELARFAKDELQRAIAGGEASKSFDRYVNGKLGVAEESVVPPGPIIYVFSYWSEIITTSLDELRKRVPIRTGRYANGFIVLANGQPVRQYGEIPTGAEVVILNIQPYTRKMETGANKTGRHHFENAKGAINRRFREQFRAETRFLDVRSGLHAGVPWILRKHAGRRRDRRAGMPITYPALVLNMVN